MKKYIIDGDTTSDVKPNVAFDFSNFQRNTFTGNVIYAEKFTFNSQTGISIWESM